MLKNILFKRLLSKFFSIKKATILLFLYFVFFINSSIYAAVFKFSQSNYNVNLGDSLEVRIDIDTEGEEVSGGEVYIKYDNTKLNVEEVFAGTFFDEVTYQDNNGILYIAGTFSSTDSLKSGSDEFATIKFKTIASGNVSLEFVCNTNETETSSIQKISNGQNQELIDCSNLEVASVSINEANSSDNGNNSSETKGGLTTESNTTVTMPVAGSYLNISIFILLGIVILFFSFLFSFKN